MILYYGSKTYFEKPIFGLGSNSNDYGLGLYMTDSYDMAKLWASKSKSGGYVLTFDIDLSSLRVLHLSTADEIAVLEWISLLVQNRFDFTLKQRYIERINWLDKKFHADLSKYDFVIGYRADDSYFNYSKGFVANELSLEALSKAMIVGKLGLQFVALSKKAFSHIRFVKAEKVEYAEDYEQLKGRALEEYRKLKNEDSEDNTFIRDLIRKYGK